jgi:Spy/CpxP family protein refolding chaperone
MKKWNKSLVAIATAICMGTAGLAANAFATGQDMEIGPGYGEDGRQEGRWQVFMTKKHAALHDKLKLSASQEGAWKTYTDATMKNLTPAKRTPVDLDNMPAPQRMEKWLEFMKERQTRMEAQLGALKTFYATLTPEQQKVFDSETAPKKWREKARERWQKKQQPADK